MNLKQKDVAPLFGGENRASEIFNGIKELNMKMVINLHKYLGIPYESLVQEAPKYKLESDKVKLLLKAKPIAEYQRVMAHH
jgi:plasmid maintenance system antidote protein VapI